MKLNYTSAFHLFCSLFIFSLLSSTYAQEEAHLYFDGENDYIETNHELINTIAYDFTFEAVIKGNAESQGEDPTIFSNRWSHIKGNTFYLKDLGDGPRVLCYSHGGDEYYIPNNGTYAGSLLDGNCHHVAIVKAGTDIRFYADGVLFGELINPYYYCESLNGWSPLWIGRDHYYDNPFQGVIAQVRLWDEARSTEDLFDNMHESLSGSETNLVGYWELNAGSGQYVLEKHGETWIGLIGSDNIEDMADPNWFVGSYCMNEDNYGDGEDDEEDDPKQEDDLGIDRSHDLVELSLYPNPVNTGILTVSFSENIEIINLQMTNLKGQLIYSTNSSDHNNQIQINTSDFVNGVYIIHLQTNQGNSTKKVVLQ